MAGDSVHVVGPSRIFLANEKGDAWFLCRAWLDRAQLTTALRTSDNCATVRPIEMRGSQLIGLSLIMRHRGQWQAMWVKPSAANSSMVACKGFITSRSVADQLRPPRRLLIKGGSSVAVTRFMYGATAALASLTVVARLRAIPIPS